MEEKPTDEVQKQKEASLEDLKKFILELSPVVSPLIKDYQAIERKRICFELVFLTLIIVLGGLLIWSFIQNGKPDTAEKITFALLGFLGGRGFTVLSK